MKTTITKFTRWICRQLTFDEFSSMVALMLEISSGSQSGYDFKPEPQTANYRKFAVDTNQPVLAPEPHTAPQPKLNWKQLKTDYEHKTGKILKPVRRRGGLPLPVHCRCEKCNAPAEYLYLNDGKKANQVLCKVCRHLGTTERVRRQSQAKYFCPHCSKPLSQWKTSSTETIYKCMSNDCPHCLKKKSALTPEE